MANDLMSRPKHLIMGLSCCSCRDTDTYEFNIGEPIEKLPEPVSEASTTGFSKTFTTFSGADMIVLVNDKVVGDIQDIKHMKVTPTMALRIMNANETYYDYDLIVKYPVVVVMEQVLFDEELDATEPIKITLRYADSYGNYAEQEIPKAVLLYSDGGMGVDDIVNSRRMIFAATDITPFKLEKRA